MISYHIIVHDTWWLFGFTTTNYTHLCLFYLGQMGGNQSNNLWCHCVFSFLTIFFKCFSLICHYRTCNCNIQQGTIEEDRCYPDVNWYQYLKTTEETKMTWKSIQQHNKMSYPETNTDTHFPISSRQFSLPFSILKYSSPILFYSLSILSL